MQNLKKVIKAHTFQQQLAESQDFNQPRLLVSMQNLKKVIKAHTFQQQLAESQDFNQPRLLNFGLLNS
jgi:spore maturation protein CgeB